VTSVANIGDILPTSRYNDKILKELEISVLLAEFGIFLLSLKRESRGLRKKGVIHCYIYP
jgi:hypothetical protein